jgi:uncharacterized protein YndB with AHSA1/START domain
MNRPGGRRAGLHAAWPAVRRNLAACHAGILRMSRPAHVEIEIAALPEVVFDAWLQPEVVRHWLFVDDRGEIVSADIDARVGGRFSILERGAGEESGYSGEYHVIERPTRLAFSLEAPRHFRGVSQVRVDISHVEGASRLVLEQTGVDPDVMEQRWRDMFASLRAVLEVGA